VDIYEYLKKDHKKVSDLFALYEKTEDQNTKIDIVTLITTELLIHAETEKETFYKTLEEYAKTDDVAHHGEEEHLEIEAVIEEIAQLKQYGKTFDTKVMKLKKMVEHHVKEEEGEMFSKAKKVLSAEEAYALKEKMHFLKGEVKEDL
jgi:hemerythrin superfamily protein